MRVSIAPVRHVCTLMFVLLSCQDSNSTGARPEPASSTGPGSGTMTDPETTAGSAVPSTGFAASTTAASEPTMELGTGKLQWLPLGHDGEVELVAGPQGGWHVDVAVRAHGVAPDEMNMRYEAFLVETDVSVSYPTMAMLTPDNVVRTETGWDRVGDRVVFDIVDAASVVETAVCIVVELESPTFVGRDERCVTVVDEQP